MNSKYLYIIIGLVFIGAFVLGVFLLLGSNDSSSQNIVQNSTTGSSKIDTNILKEGEKAPDFSVTTIDGVDLTLSDFENKTLVLTSGAAWCPTCIIENKNFFPVYEEVKDKDVEFITVDIDPIDSLEAIKEFQKLYAPWHNVHVSTARNLITDYNFWRFEITYIIDKDGIIRFSDSGITDTDTLRDELNKII